MTAELDTFKQEIGSTTHLIGKDWQNLIELIESRPDEDEGKCFDGGGSQTVYRSEDNVLRTLHDVKRLRQKDMPLFGRCPETDNFYTVVCSACSMILMPNALKNHWEKRHGDDIKSSLPSEKIITDSPGKSKSKKVTPIKSEKVDKTKRIKGNSLQELNEDAYKDSKRGEKLKKGKSSEKPAEVETVTVKSEKSKSKNTRLAPELQPVVALSPIQVAENEKEECESRDSGKNKKRDKKKSDRKADKIYDPDKHCGVINEGGKHCLRSILCKVHQVALKRAVGNRTMPYDMLIKILKNQNEDDKAKAESEAIRVPKIEPSVERKEPPVIDALTPNVQIWAEEQVSVKAEEPPNKRLKIKEEVVEEDVDQSHFTLPSHLEALIDETLKTLKDVDESEPLPVISVAPKPEPLIRWNLDPPSPPKAPSPPAHLVLDDIHWHSSHPKPLATNTFGCRLIGGLMSTCKKLDTLRKHLQSVWTSANSSPTAIRSGFNDVYNPNSVQNTNSANVNSKNNFPTTKYAKKTSQNKGNSLVKRNAVSVLGKTSTMKRKRRSNSNVIAPVQNPTSNASEIISGLLISNPMPVQRATAATVPTIPTGVIPVNSISGNGVPLRLFQGSLPVIASAAPNQPATFIQLNLCPPK